MTTPTVSPTDEELLQEVRSAISSILTKGQSYTIGDRTFNRADLKDLRAMEKDLQAAIRRSGGVKMQYGVPI